MIHAIIYCTAEHIYQNNAIYVSGYRSLSEIRSLLLLRRMKRRRSTSIANEAYNVGKMIKLKKAKKEEHFES